MSELCPIPRVTHALLSHPGFMFQVLTRPCPDPLGSVPARGKIMVALVWNNRLATQHAISAFVFSVMNVDMLKSRRMMKPMTKLLRKFVAIRDTLQLKRIAILAAQVKKADPTWQAAARKPRCTMLIILGNALLKAVKSRSDLVPAQVENAKQSLREPLRHAAENCRRHSQSGKLFTLIGALDLFEVDELGKDDMDSDANTVALTSMSQEY